MDEALPGEDVTVEPEEAARALSRRRFLMVVGGGVGAAALVPRMGWSTRALAATVTQPCTVPANLSPTLVRTLVRRADMVNVTFSFFNLRLDPSQNNLVKVNASAPAYIAADVGPQAWIEETRHLAQDAGANPAPPPIPIQAKRAASSRVAFRVPDATSSVPFTAAALLAWDHLPLNVVDAAQTHPSCALGAAPRLPVSYETSLELPWGLILSPDEQGAFNGATAPVTRPRPGSAPGATGGSPDRTELWHARLVERFSFPGHPVELTPVPVRAVWSAGDPFNPCTDTSHDFEPPADTRRQLVTLTSDRRYPARPATANQLMLSALGGYVDVAGAWDISAFPRTGAAAVSVDGWRQRVTLGRDQYVKVVAEGFLLPLGHRASWIQIEERSSEVDGTVPNAYLDQFSYIVVNQDRVDYPVPGQPNAGRDWPFTSVRIVGVQSPRLDQVPGRVATNTCTTQVVSAPPDDDFFPTYDNGKDVLWSLIGTDAEGREIHFQAPLMWASRTAVGDHTKQAAAAARYHRTWAFPGTLVAFAPAVAEPGGTSHPTSAMEITASSAAVDGVFPGVFPVLASATVRVAALEEVTGGPGDVTVSYPEAYRTSGFSSGANGSGAYLALPAPPVVAFSADKAGGMLTPNFALNALSVHYGPVNVDPADLASKQFDPTRFFDPSAKLLGLVPLGSIVAAGQDLSAAPKVATALEGLAPGVPPTRRTTTVTWETTDLVETPLFTPRLPDGASARLHVACTLVTELANPGASTSDLTGTATSFSLTVAEVVRIDVNRFGFASHNGAPPTFDVDIAGVSFVNELAFVNDLADLAKEALGGTPLTITPSPTGVAADLTLAIPSISLGVFSLQNISLRTGVSLDFLKGLAGYFGFCDKADPFLLTIGIFGGGGFFTLEFDESGVTGIEAGLTFGAAAALDLAVVSGSISILAAVTFTDDNGTVTLGGSLNFHGHLEAFGLVGVTLDAYAGFTYQDGGKIDASCEVTVSVEIAGLSKSASFGLERKFGGSNDPSFAAMVLSTPEHPDWPDYCKAFAAVGS